MFICEGVLINRNGGKGWQFLLIIGTALRSCNNVTQINIKDFRLHLRRTVYLHLIFSWLAFSHFYCAFQKNKINKKQNRNKLQKILNLSHRLKWNTSSQIYNQHLILI